jgi:hypothetical protein
VNEAYDRARADLDAPASRSLNGVVWLSAHLAALDHALHPVIQRAVPGTAEALQRQHVLARRLHQLLRSVERERSGGASIAGMPWPQLRGTILASLTDHAAAERELVRRLAEALSPDDVQDVLDRYAHAMAHGPTRPHPHMPATGVLGGIAYRLEAMRDHILDTLDSRPTFPRPQIQRPAPGRWGQYVLGHGDFPRDDGSRHHSSHG